MMVKPDLTPLMHSRVLYAFCFNSWKIKPVVLCRFPLHHDNSLFITSFNLTIFNSLHVVVFYIHKFLTYDTSLRSLCTPLKTVDPWSGHVTVRATTDRNCFSPTVRYFFFIFFTFTSFAVYAHFGILWII